MIRPSETANRGVATSLSLKIMSGRGSIVIVSLEVAARR